MLSWVPEEAAFLTFFRPPNAAVPRIILPVGLGPENCIPGPRDFKPARIPQQDAAAGVNDFRRRVQMPAPGDARQIRHGEAMLDQIAPILAATGGNIDAIMTWTFRRLVVRDTTNLQLGLREALLNIISEI